MGNEARRGGLVAGNVKGGDSKKPGSVKKHSCEGERGSDAEGKVKNPVDLLSLGLVRDGSPPDAEWAGAGELGPPSFAGTARWGS